MGTLNSNSRFVVKHAAGTPDDPNLASPADLAAFLTDSTTSSLVASRLVSTSAAGALDSVPVSTADSKAVSGGVRASVADSKALSTSIPTSVADSKALSVSVLTSIADSKAVSVSNAPSFLVGVAASQNTSIADSKGLSSGVLALAGSVASSIADSKAASVSTNLLPIPSGRSTTTATAYFANNAVFNVRDYSTSVINTGAIDATTAIQAAVTAAMVAGGIVRIPAGTYLVSDTITIASYGVRIVGDGWRTTFIKFVPTSAKVCFDFINSNAAITLGHCGIAHIQGMSTDTTFKKTFVKATDVSEFEMEYVRTASSWTGASSIGFETCGRELVRSNSCTFYADKPLVISQNPRHATIDCDMFHFHDLYLSALTSSTYNVTVGEMRSLQHLTFDGTQIWTLGKGGFNWISTAASQDCVGVVFQNIRYEQSQDATGVGFTIDRNAFLVYGIRFVNCSPNATQHGIKLRRVSHTTIDNLTWSDNGGSLKVLDIDSTCHKTSWRNLWTQVGAGSNISGQNLVWGAGRAASVDYTLLPHAAYDSAAGDFTVGTMSTLQINGPISQNVTALPQYGFYSNRTLTAVSAAADMLRLIPILTAAANGDTLRGINLAPTYTIGAFTGVTAEALRIANVSGAATNNAITTGTGKVNFGDDVKLTVAGSGLYIKEGSNATLGRATLVAGTVVVSTTKVTNVSEIQLTGQVDGGAPGWVRVSNRSAGVSFTITSSSGTDTSVVAWQIVEPA